ncbi:hypothetical protein CYMTET_21315, partial [Cymbomonas tetramitiformis]
EHAPNSPRPWNFGVGPNDEGSGALVAGTGWEQRPGAHNSVGPTQDMRYLSTLACLDKVPAQAGAPGEPGVPAGAGAGEAGEGNWVNPSSAFMLFIIISF